MEAFGRLWGALVTVLSDGLAIFHSTFAEWGVPGGWALAIVAFTLVIKIVTLPLTWQQLKSSKAMQELQPKLRELQKQSGKDKEKQMQEQMRLYREHGVNPALGCLPMVIQLPVWFALYQALANLPGTYPDFAQPFLWISNLADPEAQLTFPGWPPVTGWPILTLFTGVSQWLLQKMMTPHSDDPQQQMMGQMMQLMPLMFVFFAFQVPAGLVLYWATSNIFSLVQQYFVTGWGSLVPASRSAASATNRHTAGTTTSPRDAGPAIAAAAADPGDGREPDSEPSEALTRGRRRKGKRKK